MKTETGVMIMKDGKAWGITYEDGHTTSYGWIDPKSAPIYDPKYCKKNQPTRLAEQVNATQESWRVQKWFL